MKLAVYILALSVSQLVFGGSLEDCKVFRSLSANERDVLHERLVTPGNPAANLLKAASDIDLTRPVALLNPSDFNLSGVQGLNNGGVYIVHNHRGEEFALKVTKVQAYAQRGHAPSGSRMDHPLIKEPILIHQRLGEMGVAPKLLGFLTKTQMRKLDQTSRNLRQEPLNLAGEPAVGLLMERIPDAWSSVHDAVPSWLAKWPEARLRKAVEKILKIEDTLDSLRIQADDPQLLISKKGRVVLGDLDRYRMQRPSDFNDLGFMGRELIEHWEKATGRKASFTFRSLVQAN